MTAELIVAGVVPVAIAAIGLYLRDRSEAGKQDTRAAVMQERMDQIPSQIKTALLEWEGPFLQRLNGTYMRTPLIEAHLKGITDHVGSVQQNVTEMKGAIREAVRLEVGNAIKRLQRPN